MRNTINFDEIDEHGPQSYDATFNDVTAKDLGRDEVSGVGPVHIEARADRKSVV